MEKPSRFVGDIPPGGIPAGADPFAHVAQFPPHRFIPRLSRQAISILAVFLVFQILLSVFSLIILILPYIGKVRRTPWLVRKIYIYSSSGEKRLSDSMLNAGCRTVDLMLFFSFCGRSLQYSFIFSQCWGPDVCIPADEFSHHPSVHLDAS
jgi:hypothetical protein